MSFFLILHYGAIWHHFCLFSKSFSSFDFVLHHFQPTFHFTDNVMESTQHENHTHQVWERLLLRKRSGWHFGRPFPSRGSPWNIYDVRRRSTVDALEEYMLVSTFSSEKIHNTGIQLFCYYKKKRKNFTERNNWDIILLYFLAFLAIPWHRNISAK